MAEDQHGAETTTKDNIHEHDLELCLGIRPLHASPRNIPSKVLHEHDNKPICGDVLAKRDAQAARRYEAKVKRDLKRKASLQNGVVVLEHDQHKAMKGKEDEEEGVLERRRKGDNFGMQPSFVTPPMLWGNAGGFRPYQGQNGKIVGQHEGENRSSISSGSSSGLSDNYHSNSGSGGNSSDAGSHSSHSHSQLTPANAPTASTSLIQPCSSHLEVQPNGFNTSVSQPKLCLSSSNQRDLFTSSRQSSESPEGLTSSDSVLPPSKTQPNDITSVEKEPNPTPRSPSPKEAKGVIGKPPKPNGQLSQQKVMLPQMPCVSTTGNGPTGKTITGFLYKYSKSEVSIVCVCHGASFTPAGFVEHAGGVDVEHPLRHIRVVPFAVGQ